MRSDEHKAGSPTTKNDDYETTVLDFLEKEVSGPSKAADEHNAPPEDVDVLVDSLLQQAITASNQQEKPSEVESDDIDLLFSRIFSSQAEMAPAQSRAAVREIDPSAGRTLKEAGQVEKGNANLRLVQIAPVQETVGGPLVATDDARDTVSIEASPGRFPLTSVEKTDEAQTDRNPPAAASGTGALTDRSPVFTLVPQKQSRTARTILLAGAAACLLAGVGIVYLAGSKNAAVSDSSQQVPPLTQTSPAETQAVTLQQTQPNPVGTAGSTPIVAARPSGSPIAPAILNVGNSNKSGAPAKEAKPATAGAPAPPVTTIPGAGTSTAAAAALVEKTVPPVETTAAAASPPARPAEITSPPPAVQVPEPPAANLRQLVPNTGQSLDGVARLKGTAIPLPAPPKNITPAEVISRVVPVYPDIARRSHTTGTVVVAVQIDERGRVTRATAESGPSMLRPEAVNAVLQWRFRPANIDGTNVSSSSKVSIVFKEPS